ncbi:protein kinase family protein [Bacillus songklensis]|uniref:Protein kinase family protein n=1 Tax=Bacillus songklensis TaxID=1069116 RepID=A0ABV8AWX9_9BACI
MNDLLKNQVCNLSTGTVVKGKWHHHAYRIVRKLGSGATGVVYLAESAKVLVALKISFNNMSVTSEVNVLRHFAKAHGKVLGPSLLDVDDWESPLSTSPLSFYVMEYLKGEPFLTFVKKRGAEWTGILTLQLLNDLHHLHESGWVFGDLKPENLIVTESPIKIRWLDVGGTTLQGRSIKEFTDFYDRGYWGLGTRKAEPSYDLFAVAMIMINTAYPKRFAKQENGLFQLKQIIESNQILKSYHHCLFKALTGKYNHALQMRADLLRQISGQPSKEPVGSKKATHTQKTNPKKIQSRIAKRRKKRYHVLETILLFLSLMVAYAMYVLIQTW